MNTITIIPGNVDLSIIILLLTIAIIEVINNFPSDIRFLDSDQQHLLSIYGNILSVMYTMLGWRIRHCRNVQLFFLNFLFKFIYHFKL